MSEEINIKSYVSGDEHQIVPLLKKGYKEWPFFDIDCTAEDHWRWKYNNQYNKSIVLKMEYQDKIIGATHNILNMVRINGKNYLGAYGTDLCIDPDFQGKGLSPKLGLSLVPLRKQANVTFVYMVTVHPKVIGSSTRDTLYSEFPYVIKYLSRVDDIDRHIKGKDLEDGYVKRLRHFIDSTRSESTRELEADVKICKVDSFDPRIDEFIEKVNEGNDFIINRSREYLNWRYCDPRGGKYNVQIIEEDDQILGYEVLRINKLKEYYTGFIVDLLAVPGRLDVAENLLLNGLNHFKENDVNEVVFQAVEGHPYEKLFNRYGFYGGEGNRYFFYRYTGGSELNMGNISPDRVHISFGDLTGI